ncbi:MAG: MBL fold metallo-hydrolase [archaeon]
MSSITFLGTGNAWNHNYDNTSALFEFNNTNLLIDCGFTTPINLNKINKLGEIDNIWISHTHGDHIYGLEEIAFRNKFLYKRKINLFIARKNYKDIKSCLEATLQYDGANKKLQTLDNYFNVCIIDKGFSIKGYKFTIEKTKHAYNMSSYMLYGNNFIYTGDTQFIDWSRYDLSKIKYIFHDTQLAKYDNNAHAPLQDLLTLPNNIRKKIWCMHYGEDIEKYKSTIFNNNMKIVDKFDKIELKDDKNEW